MLKKFFNSLLGGHSSHRRSYSSSDFKRRNHYSHKPQHRSYSSSDYKHRSHSSQYGHQHYKRKHKSSGFIGSFFSS